MHGVFRVMERRESQRNKVAPFTDITNDDDLRHAAVHSKADRIEPSSISLPSSRAAYGTATPSGAEEEKPLKVRTSI